MASTPTRLPDEFRDLIDSLQAHVAKEVGAVISKREVILLFMSVAQIDKAKLARLLEKMKTESRARHHAIFSFEEK